MKFKLTITALALAILLSLGVARATGWPNTHSETKHAQPVSMPGVSAPPANAVPPSAPRPAPAHDRTVSVGGTTAACALLLAGILIHRARRR
jgi:hypothetical protein